MLDRGWREDEKLKSPDQTHGQHRRKRAENQQREKALAYRREVAPADTGVVTPSSRVGCRDLIERQGLSWFSVMTRPRLGHVYGSTVLKTQLTTLMAPISLGIISPECRSVAHDQARCATNWWWFMPE
jgi:hypothetical protein